MRGVDYDDPMWQTFIEQLSLDELTVSFGGCNISLGTSGTIFISSKNFGVDPHNALHAFAHADGGYHLMGCMLSAASCNKWFCDEILKTKDYAGEQADITTDHLGKNRVFFLPYLMGERSPINDVDARACFVGMSMDTTRADLMQAVLEGVAFATRGTLEGDIAPGEITFFRLQCDSDGNLRSYIAEGEVLPVATTSFGGIGVFAIREMGRFYRHVLIQKRFPHHGAVAFGHHGKALFEVFKFLGVADIGWNQPKSLPYPTENPWA